MVEESQNSKKTIKHLRRGLGIYKTGRSPFWHVRIYDAVKKKYVVRSTKESNRIEAAEVAEEIVETYKQKQNSAHAVSRDRSFEHYAKMLSEITKQKAKASRNKYAFSDQSKILFREKDGLVSYFGKHDVGKITSGNVRDYLLFLDKRREKPLAMSTKSKQCGVIRQVLMLALEDGVIDIIPPMPKQRTVDKPRVSFSDAEYGLLLSAQQEHKPKPSLICLQLGMLMSVWLVARHILDDAHLSPTQHARSVALVAHCAMFRLSQGIRRSPLLRDTSMEVKMRE